MGITTLDVSRSRRAGTIVFAMAVVGLAAGCAPRTKPGDPLPGLRRSERARFDRGKEVFQREFTPATGLGPLFNSASCGECHEEPAAGGSGDEIEVHATAFRPHGAVNGPVGAAGGKTCDDLADQGGPVVQQHVIPALHDALGIDEEPVPPRATATGRRSSPSVLGFGLLDEVPDDVILSYSDPDDLDHDGVSGSPSRFTDGRIGRFGRKAFVPTLREFNAGAFLIELGITSPVLPSEDTIGGKPVPPGVDTAPDPELSQEDLDLATDFVRFLAPPAGKQGPGVQRGRESAGRITEFPAEFLAGPEAVPSEVPIPGRTLPPIRKRTPRVCSVRARGAPVARRFASSASRGR